MVIEVCEDCRVILFSHEERCPKCASVVKVVLDTAPTGKEE